LDEQGVVRKEDWTEERLGFMRLPLSLLSGGCGREWKQGANSRSNVALAQTRLEFAYGVIKGASRSARQGRDFGIESRSGDSDEKPGLALRILASRLKILHPVQARLLLQTPINRQGLNYGSLQTTLHLFRFPGA
jgi:hypothetical protein